MVNAKLCLTVTFGLLAWTALVASGGPAAPILDIENESIGYYGRIGERNVLVDLKPHLQIKNIDSINGVCSYHVFKPNNEEFPFNIDIKDKVTGEAVFQVEKKELKDSSPSSPLLLDCNKRKEFNFLIQAHDCSSPSLASNKFVFSILLTHFFLTIPFIGCLNC
jgi:hypothetical protein